MYCMIALKELSYPVYSLVLTAPSPAMLHRVKRPKQFIILYYRLYRALLHNVNQGRIAARSSLNNGVSSARDS